MKFKTKVIAWGNSLGLRVPSHLVRRQNLVAGDEVEILPVEDGFVVKKVQPQTNRTINDLFAGYEFRNEPLRWNEKNVE